MVYIWFEGCPSLAYSELFHCSIRFEILNLLLGNGLLVVRVHIAGHATFAVIRDVFCISREQLAVRMVTRPLFPSDWGVWRARLRAVLYQLPQVNWLTQLLVCVVYTVHLYSSVLIGYSFPLSSSYSILYIYLSLIVLICTTVYGCIKGSAQRLSSINHEAIIELPIRAIILCLQQ